MAHRHEARRSTHRNGHQNGVPPPASSANSTQPGFRGQPTSVRRERDRDRARQTRRKLDSRARRSQMVVPPTPSLLSSRSCLVDRMSYLRGGEIQGSMSSRHEASSHPQPQRGRFLQERVASEDDLSGDVDLGPSDLLHGSQKDKAERIDSDRTDVTGADVNDVDLFGPEPSLPRPLRQPLSTRPVQYDFPYHLPSNHFQHPPRSVLPATKHEPNRMLNTSATPESYVEATASSSVAGSPSTTTIRATDAKKHPANSYKGNDPIKKMVQNKRLQLVLSGKPMPKPRKKPDRMVLKCTGKQEFR
ncbi:hypothetical protein SVAN01_04990 [Stagonosporopsis vannaccii]|nr:hypothetical protein SVAN01_04990 [Stagonosporopsis vannaccii]